MSKFSTLSIKSAAFLCLLAISLASTDCSLSETENNCTSQSGCAWTQTTVTTCQQQLDCQKQSQVDCSNAQLSGYCEWTAPVQDTCIVQPSACKLIDTVNNVCSNQNSCSLIAETITTCNAIPKNFQCSEITNEPNCSSPAQCTWQNASCISGNVCENLDISKCTNSACNAQVTTCTPSIDAEATCSGYKTSQACTEGGCSFDDQQQVCSPPNTCTVQNNACTSAVCVVAQGTCSTKPAACSTTDQASCDTQYCKWSTTAPVCVNNLAYCTVKDCANQGPYCESGTATQVTCQPKGTNECSPLTFIQCTADNVKDLCVYKAGKEGYCSNPYETCSSLSASQCSSEKSCKQNQEQKNVCTTVVVPNNTHSSIKVAISIFLCIFATFI